MQRSSAPPWSRASAPEPASPTQDPRRNPKARASRSAEGVGVVGTQNSGRRSEDTTLTSDLQSTANRPNNASSNLPPPELEQAFSSYVAEVVKADHWTRRRAFLSREAVAAQEEYEKEKNKSSQFPGVVEQVQQKKKQIEAEYHAAKGEEDRCMAMRQTCGSEYVRLQFDLFATSFRDYNEALTARVHALEQDHKDRPSQQADSVTMSRTDLEQMLSRFRNLEESRDRQMEHERKVDAELAKHTEKEQRIMRSCSAIDEAVKALKADHEGFQQHIQQRVTALEARIQDCVAKPDLQEKLQRMEKLMKDQIERARTNFLRKIEDVQDRLDSLSSVLEEGSIQSKRFERDFSTRLNNVQGEFEQLTGLERQFDNQVTQSAQFSERLNKVEEELGQLTKSVEEVDDHASSEKLNLLEQQFGQFKADQASSTRKWNENLDSIHKELEDLKASKDVAGIVDGQKHFQIQLADLAAKLQAVRGELEENIRSSNGRFAEHESRSAASPNHLERTLTSGFTQAQHKWLTDQFDEIRKTTTLEKISHHAIYQSQYIRKVGEEIFVEIMVGPVSKSVSQIQLLWKKCREIETQIKILLRNNSVHDQESTERDGVESSTGHEDPRVQSHEPRDNHSKDVEDSTRSAARLEADQPTDRGSAGETVDAPRANVDATDPELTQTPRRRSARLENSGRELRSTAHPPHAPSDDLSFGSPSAHDNPDDGLVTDADAAYQVSDDADDDDDDHASEEGIPKTSKKSRRSQSKRTRTRRPAQSSPRQPKPSAKRKYGLTKENHIDLTQESDEDDDGPPSRRIRL